MDVLDVAPETSSALGTPMKGFYFWENGEVVLSTYSPLTQDASDTGGIYFDLDSSPDYYQWCTPEIEPLNAPALFLPVGRDYHNLEMSVTTATAPTFTNDGIVYQDSAA